jgi:hypothetical protein
MDYELEALTPPSRLNRSLGWLAAASGLALALFLVGTPGAATQPATETASEAFTPPASSQDFAVQGTKADSVTTGSIVPAAPVRVVQVSAASSRNLPLPQSERHLLIVLLFACFAVMAIGGIALWKRGWNDLVRQSRPEDR